MARFDIAFRPESLERTVAITVIIPDECKGTDVPLLYLLHGMYGDHTAWTRGSLVERYARERKIAVVMADAENSYYTDQAYGSKYFTFFSKELPLLVHKWFRQLTSDPKKTYIAGLSMGGYGALYLGLSDPFSYAGIASFSGVVDLPGLLNADIDWKHIAVANWGEDFATAVKHSKHDIDTLICDMERSGTPFPRLYVACGTEDFLFESNERFSRRLSNVKGLDFCYEKGAGAHTWDFWNEYLPRALDYLLK